MISVFPTHGSGYRPAPIGDSIARQCYSTSLGPPLAVTRLTALREKNPGILGPDLLLKKAEEAAGLDHLLPCEHGHLSG